MKKPRTPPRLSIVVLGLAFKIQTQKAMMKIIMFLKAITNLNKNLLISKDLLLFLMANHLKLSA